MFAVVLDQLADQPCAGVFYSVVGQIQDLEACVLHVYFAIGSFLDLKHEGDWFLRRSFLALLVALKDLIPRLLF